MQGPWWMFRTMMKRLRTVHNYLVEIVVTTAHALQQHKKWTLISTLLFSLLFLFATGAINWYVWIPDWVPSTPTIFTPAHEFFEVYALWWGFSEHWLLSLEAGHASSFFFLVILFAANVALLLELWRRRRGLGETAVGMGGFFTSLFGFFACCAPALGIALFGAGFVFALEPYSGPIEGLAIGLLALNVFLLNRALKK